MDYPHESYWLHLPNQPDWKVYQDLCDHLLDFTPEADILFTGPPQELCMQNLGDLGSWVEQPKNDEAATVSFLNKHKPQVVAWFAGQTHGAIFSTLATKKIPLHLIDSGEFLKYARRPRFLPRLGRSDLRFATTITIGDVETMKMLKRERVPETRIYYRGKLERGSSPPSADMSEVERFSELAKARPIWLAAGVGDSEVDMILNAHLQSLRRAHRLLLVLEIANPDYAGEIEQKLRVLGMTFARRSQGIDPGPDTQVILADVSDELGLWLRLCPLSYMGQTQVGHAGHGPDPFHAAALGSAIIHGPEIDAYPVSYARLIEADATCPIANGSELAYAMQLLLSADRSAELALRAWRVSSADAEMHTHVAALLSPPVAHAENRK